MEILKKKGKEKKRVVSGLCDYSQFLVMSLTSHHDDRGKKRERLNARFR